MTTPRPAAGADGDGPLEVSWWELRRCGNPACRRKVGGSARYCCGMCSLAHDDGWDIDGEHAGSCDQRAAARDAAADRRTG